MATDRQYRISFNETCRPLKAFRSSRELVISIRDAMEGAFIHPIFLSIQYLLLGKAHDRLYFDTQILHCNINVVNILTSATGRGLLADWELSIENTSLRPMVGTTSFPLLRCI